MIIPYRNGCWSAFGYFLVIAFLGPLVVSLILKAKQYGTALVCTVLAVIILGGALKRFNYGMHIGKRRIVLFSQQEMKVVPYASVREVVVTFTQENVTALVKTEDEEIRFVWKDLVVDSRKTFPGLGWGYKSSAISHEGIHMTDRFVAKSIERLSQCEKVRIEDLRSSSL